MSHAWRIGDASSHVHHERKVSCSQFLAERERHGLRAVVVFGASDPKAFTSDSKTIKSLHQVDCGLL